MGHMTEWNISEEAAALHRDALVWDMTVVWMLSAPVAYKLELLSRLAAGGCDAVSLALAYDWGREEPLAMLAQERALLAEHPDRFVLFESADDIIKAKREGRLAVDFHFISYPSRTDIAMLEDYYRLGVRHFICHTPRATEGENHIESDDGSLTRFGSELVKEMNRLGMIVDVSHSKYQTSMDILELSKDPVIFSHSNAAALWNHSRNIRDDQIRASAKSGGVIGVVGTGTYIGDNDNSTEGLVRHIDYVAELVGPEHVGLGIDYISGFGAPYPPQPAGWNEERHVEGHRIASGGKSEAPRREDIKYVEPEGMLPITEVLIDHGYSEKEIRGIVGENWLRVARQVWKQPYPEAARMEASS
jgi:membrane dipeptidase